MSAQQLRITLAGRECVADAGTTAGGLFLLNGTGGAAADGPVIAVRVNGELGDLATPLADGDEVEPVELDDGDDRMQKKIRTAQRQKVPYMLLAGDDDVAAGAVSLRYRSGEQKNGVPVDEAVAEITGAVNRPILV